MKIFVICRRYLQCHTKKLIILTAYSVAIQVTLILTPYIIGGFVDGLIAQATMDYVFRFCIILSMATIARLIFQYLQSVLSAKLQSQMGYEHNRDVIFYIQDLPINFMENKNIAQINSQVNEDTNALIMFCLNILQTFVLHLVALPSLLIICSFIHLKITICYMVYCILYIIVYNVIKSKKYKLSRKLYNSRNVFFSKMFEQMQCIEFIKTNGIQDYFRKRLENPFKNLYTSIIQNQKFDSFLVTVDQLLSLLADVTLYFFGAYQILKGNFSVGNFIVFSAYFAMVKQSIQYFYNFGATYQQTLVSFDRIKSITSLQPEPVGDRRIDNIKNINFNNLTFSYNLTNKILEKFSLELVVGNIYAFIGHNGTGKSTVAKLLLGLYNDQLHNMSLMLNNIDIKDIDKCLLRHELIAYVEQSPTLLDTSLCDNILLDRVSEENILNRIQDLAHILNIDKLVFCEDKTNQDIQSLSGGERQKIALIRALIKNAQIMILDEPTAALDRNSVNVFLNCLNKIKKEKIILIITHDENVVNASDKIITMENSDID